ncbi:MAG: hypothetical protein IPL75_17110 [Acidobacteria bacterium]|nr:hypothetical protein [Acidobacteriota bacterium]
MQPLEECANVILDDVGVSEDVVELTNEDALEDPDVAFFQASVIKEWRERSHDVLSQRDH